MNSMQEEIELKVSDKLLDGVAESIKLYDDKLQIQVNNRIGTNVLNE